MNEEKRTFYKTLNNIVATNRIDNEESYILNNYISYLENQLQQKENIIKEIREEVKIYEEQSNDGATNELDNYVFVQRLKKVLDKGEQIDDSKRELDNN